MSEKRYDWISYVAYKLRPEYRVMPEANRFQLAAFLVEVLESPHDRVDVDCYCAVGFRSDCDFFIRYVAPTPEELQEICIKVANSGLGRYLDVAYNWIAHHRVNPDGSGYERPKSSVETPYFAVYPFAMRREWYALSADDRASKMRDHVAVQESFPNIAVDTAYSFGVGDQESVIGFQVDRLEDFESLIRRLRGTEVSAYSTMDTPVLLGKHVSAHEALEMCGAL